MAQVIRLPLIPILFAYVLGLYGGQSDLPLPSWKWIFLPILLAIWLLMLALKKARWGSVCALSFFFSFGFSSIHHYLHPSLPSSHISRFVGSERVVVEGTIDRSPQRTPVNTRWLIRSEKVISGGHHFPVDGHLLLWTKEKNPSLRLGDRIRFQCRLQRPHGFQNLGGFSFERHLAFQRIYAIGFLTDEKMIIKLGEGGEHPFFLQVEAWRDHIRHFLQREGSLPSSAIFEALVLGEQGNLSEEVREHFVATGIAHLLAISGAHLGTVAFLSFSLFLWVLKRSETILLSFSIKKWAAILTIPILLLYTWIAGGRISMIRATLMAVTFLLSIVLSRERHLLYTLALAAFLILLFSPPSLFDVSFQLSFLAVLSILYMVPRLLPYLKQKDIFSPTPSWLHRLWSYVKLSFLVTLVALLGTAPFVALHFNRLSLIGLLTNLIAIPWVGFLIMPISLFASFLSFWIYPLAQLLIIINQYLTVPLLSLIALLASLPYASVHLTTPTLFEMILFYLLLFLSAHLSKGKKVRYAMVGISLLLVLQVAYGNLKETFQQDLRITFLDVGHGDSILVQFPKGKTMLIDGGGLHEDHFDIGKKVIAPFLWKKKIRKINTLVLTHPDPDHFKGLKAIASSFRIDQFWDNGYRTETEPFLEIEKILQKRKIDRLSLYEGFPLSPINGVEISVLNPPLHPPLPSSQRSSSFLNNQSLVIKMQFKNFVLLLTGDIEREAEERMVQKGYSLRAQVLKVPHHGSISSSTPLFLASVKPDYAIVSVGKGNLWHLPHPEVVTRYERLGTKLFRTDRQGAIHLTTNGHEITITSFRPY